MLCCAVGLLNAHHSKYFMLIFCSLHLLVITDSFAMGVLGVRTVFQVLSFSTFLAPPLSFPFSHPLSHRHAFSPHPAPSWHYSPSSFSPSVRSSSSSYLSLPPPPPSRYRVERSGCDGSKTDMVNKASLLNVTLDSK